MIDGQIENEVDLKQNAESAREKLRGKRQKATMEKIRMLLPSFAYSLCVEERSWADDVVVSAFLIHSQFFHLCGKRA